MPHQNYTMLCGNVLINEESVKIVEMSDHHQAPYIEFEMITDTAEFGGHIPCVAYGPTAVHLLAFGLAAGKTLEATVQGWVRATTRDSVIVVAREVAFMVDRETREIAARNATLLHQGKPPLKRDGEAIKIPFRIDPYTYSAAD